MLITSFLSFKHQESAKEATVKSQSFQGRMGAASYSSHASLRVFQWKIKNQYMHEKSV